VSKLKKHFELEGCVNVEGSHTLELGTWLEKEATLETLLRVDLRNHKADYYGGSHARGLERCVAEMSPEEITAVLDDEESYTP